MLMFRSKISQIARTFFTKNNLFPKTKKFNTTKKLSLIAASVIFFPGYVYATTLQQNNNIIDDSTTITQVNKQAQTNTIQQSQSQNNTQTKIQQNKKQPQTQTTTSSPTITKDEDSIINFIKQFQDAQRLNLKGHTLIWYQSSGIENIDNQVINMLEKFVKQRNGSLSCPYKIIIDTTKRSKQLYESDYYKKQIQLVIIKPQSLKPIPLGRYLSYQNAKDLSYQQLFQRMSTEINQFNQINQSNLKNFVTGLGNRSTQAYILMNGPKDQIKWRRIKKRFNNFLQSKQAFSPHTTKAVITDENAMKYLGLPDYQSGQDNIYILVPDSDNVIKQGKTAYIQNNKYHIYTPQQINSSVVFPPYLQKSNPQSFTLKVSVDLNQNISSQLTKLYETLSNLQNYKALSSIPKYLYFTSITEKGSNPIQISLQRNNFDQIVHVYSPQCRYSNKEKRQLLYQGHRWKFMQDQITADSLQQWVNNILAKKIEPTYDSQKKKQTKVKSYNSKRITGQQYIDILNKNRNKPKIVFHYSQHCFSCNKFKHIYEQLAEQKNKQFDFYRIDNDYNRTQGLRNYNSTPVFVIYKDGCQYYYKNNIFTKSLLQDFLEITNKVKKIDTEVVENCVRDRKNSQFKLSEFIG